MAIDLIAQAVTDGARQSCACDVLDLSCRTLRRWHAQLERNGSIQDARGLAARHREHKHALTEQQRQEIVQVCNQPQYESLPPSQIVPILADKSIYLASESSFYRVLRHAGQCNRRGRANRQDRLPKPKAFVATGPNQVWSWDITYLPTLIAGQFLRLYMVMDLFSRKIVAWEIHVDESAEHASLLIQKACLAQGVQPEQLVLHSDNGSPMKGATMLSTLQRLGIMPSFSRPSVSNDNPYSESLFRTLKYCPKYPRKPFKDIDGARLWTLEFVNWYNGTHRHSGIKFVTPNQRHEGKDNELMKNRNVVYELAKAKYPERWKNRATRNWKPIATVWLNPDREIQKPPQLKMAA